MRISFRRRALGALFRLASVRYVAWRSCRVISIVTHRLLGGPRRWLVIFFGGIAVSAFLRRNETHVVSAVWSDAWRLGAALVFAGALWTLWTARRRIVVEQFVDWTTDAHKPDPRGVASLVVIELAALRELYTDVDQRRLPASDLGATGTSTETARTLIGTAVQSNKPLDATIQVEDVGQFLETATTESTIGVGPIQLPIGMLLGLAGRLARGPRLAGGIHVEAGTLTLAAQVSSAEGVRAWRVQRPLAERSNDQRVEVPHDMIDELALRIFTALALTGSVRWQAALNFTEALGAIKACLRTRKNRRRHLLKAERLLVEALLEDEQLSYVHYNLGVVYLELRRLALTDGDEEEAASYASSAEQVLKRQIELMPERWEAYYALALVYFDLRRLVDVIPICNRVVELRPGRANTAKVILLRGDAEYILGELGKAMRSRRNAVVDAWAGLCRAELRGTGQDEARQLAAWALANLAVSYARRPRLKEARRRNTVAFRSARRLMRRSRRLAQNDASIRFEYGAAACAHGKTRIGIKEFTAALRIQPTRALYWASLAAAQAQRLGETDEPNLSNAQAVDANSLEALEVKQAIANAFALVDCHANDPETRESLRSVARAYAFLGDTKAAADALGMAGFARECRQLLERGDASTLKKRLEREREPWKQAQLRIALGTLYLDSGRDAKVAAKYLELALQALQKPFPLEVARRRVRILLARAHLEQGEEALALQELARAVGDQPLRSDEREALADTFLRLGDYEQARVVLQDALLWAPDRGELYSKLGECLRSLATDVREPGRRQQVLRAAADNFEQALELTGKHSPRQRVWLHYKLGRLFIELGDFEDGIAHLRYVSGRAAGPLVGALLGEAYLKTRAYALAEHELTRVIREIEANGAEIVDLGAELDEPGWATPRVLTQSRALLARAYASRGANLDSADTKVREAWQSLDAVPDEAARSILRAALLLVEGLILLKRQRPEEAVDRFDQSLDLEASLDGYLNLARACRELVDDASDGAAATWRRRGAAACAHLLELDMNEDYAGEATQLLERFRQPVAGVATNAG
jgi:tetratricopeptide (TPR) repeat protein